MGFAASPGLLAQAARDVGETTTVSRVGGAMAGVPSYDSYAAHMRAAHPDRPVMTYAEFFRERQTARYGGPSAGRRC